MSVISDASNVDAVNSSIKDHTNKEENSSDDCSHGFCIGATNDSDSHADNVKNNACPDDEKKIDGKCPSRRSDKSRTNGNTIKWKIEDTIGDNDRKNTKKTLQGNEIERKRISKIVKKKL